MSWTVCGTAVSETLSKCERNRANGNRTDDSSPDVLMGETGAEHRSPATVAADEAVREHDEETRMYVRSSPMFASIPRPTAYDADAYGPTAHDDTTACDPDGDTSLFVTATAPANPFADLDTGHETSASDTSDVASTTTSEDLFLRYIARPRPRLPPTQPIPPPFLAAGLTSRPHTTYIYKISAPAPTLLLHTAHPFRTTPTGYPIFGTRRSVPVDPRLAPFIAQQTQRYQNMFLEADSVKDGLFELRLACEVRGLVKYGRVEKLVARLVERAIRDAGRGWCEVEVGVGRVEIRAAPKVLQYRAEVKAEPVKTESVKAEQVKIKDEVVSPEKATFEQARVEKAGFREDEMGVWRD